MAGALERILVVDDERFFREGIRDQLEAAGIECVLAENGAEALERAEDPEIGAVVLDVQLPDRSGSEVLQRMREARPEVGVIVLAAENEEAYVLEALRLGACDYLAKPLHDEELLLSVRRALEMHRTAVGWGQLRRSLLALVEAAEGLAADDVEPSAHAARLAEEAARVLGAGKTSVLLRDASGEGLRVVAAVGRKESSDEFDTVMVGRGVAGSAVARGEGLCVSDIAADGRFEAAPAGRYQSASFVVVPLGDGPEAWGALCATDRPDAAPFEPGDLALLRLLGRLGAAALAPRAEQPSEPVPEPEPHAEPDAELDVASDDADADAELARAVCDAITREVDAAAVLGAALRAAGDQLRAEPVSLFLWRAEAGALVREAQWEGAGASDQPRLETGRGLTGACYASGHPIVTDEPAADPRFDAEIDVPESGTPGAVWMLPVRFRDRTLGVLRAFSADPLRLSPRTAEVLGAVLSVALRNVQLTRSLVDSVEELAEARRAAGSKAG